jgi:predicted MPP superfamily phosphohydrolase
VTGCLPFRHPLRVVFVADFHVGSHANDVQRISALMDEATLLRPDLACFGGDYMNMMPLVEGGSRLQW